jgi:hypothetical protein
LPFALDPARCGARAHVPIVRIVGLRELSGDAHRADVLHAAIGEHT